MELWFYIFYVWLLPTECTPAFILTALLQSTYRDIIFTSSNWCFLSCTQILSSWILGINLDIWSFWGTLHSTRENWSGAWGLVLLFWGLVFSCGKGQGWAGLWSQDQESKYSFAAAETEGETSAAHQLPDSHPLYSRTPNVPKILGTGNQCRC